MSRMSELHAEIVEQIQSGAFTDDVVNYIMERYNFPYDVAERMVYDVEADITMQEETQYHEQMDGDHASALSSVGWGTDEDYGLFDDSDSF
jgi:hypothetical protein